MAHTQEFRKINIEGYFKVGMSVEVDDLALIEEALSSEELDNDEEIAALHELIEGIPTELNNLTISEIQQLENIDTKTITNSNWGYVGSLNQSLSNISNVNLNSGVAVPIPTNTSGSFAIK